jgi:GTPase involved in cell partitioning and DNA repair
VREELEHYLLFIQQENNELERERNELKSNFKQRPQEEKNLVKNVLLIHHEFSSEISKVKEMIEFITSIPSDKKTRTARAEEIGKDLVKLQSSLVSKHEILSKLLTQKQNFRSLKEGASSHSQSLLSQIKDHQYQITEIENYDHGNLYNKKLRILQGELARLKSLSLGGPSSSFNEAEVNATGLSTAQASIQLQEIMTENKKIEEELGRLNSKFVNKDTFLRLKREVDSKARRVEELKKLLLSKNSELEALSSSTKLNPNSKLRLLTNIVGRKSPFQMIEQLSPRSMKLRSSTLLQDIESSLKRVRSLASPTN